MDTDDRILDLARKQILGYRNQPKELLGQCNHARSVVESYRGRQLLELLQNADDASDPAKRPSRILIRLAADCLVAANTGTPFSYDGIESLVISDASPKQLHRARCIGNKGLGFRSVLSWSSAPLVLSGDWCVAFSADHARTQVEVLAQTDAGVGAVVQRWRDAKPGFPAPIMRFPFVPSDGDARLGIARGLAAEGYDTVVVLPFPQGPELERIRDEVLAQFAEIAGEALLFCYHLEELRIESLEGTPSAQWRLTRSNDGGYEKVLVEHPQGPPRCWAIHRRQGELPASFVDASTRDTSAWEIAVAVPQGDVDPSQGKLCVFFPTDEVLPMRMLAHATLETNDSRKRLNDHAANRFVLAQLAELLPDVAEIETHRDPARGMFLLGGCENCDPELARLGFREALLSACRQRRLFPRADGQVGPASDVRTAGHPVWAEAVPATVLPELLCVPEDLGAAGLLKAVNIQAYTEAELAQRVERWARELSPQHSGQLLGRLLAAGQIPRHPLPQLLRGSSERVTPLEHTIFLPPESGAARLPPWLAATSFLDRDFAEACRSAAGIGNMRDLRARLAEAGYKVEEFQFEAVARRLEQEAYAHDDLSEDQKLGRCRDTLACLFELSKTQEGIGSLKASVTVITAQGHRHPADTCYLGPEYPSGALVHALYAGLGKDEFVAGPDRLGLTVASVQEVERFLRRLGVADRPRLVTVHGNTDPNNALTEDFIQQTIDSGDYPAYVGSGEDIADSAQDLKDRFYHFRIGGMHFPDRFADILRMDDVEPAIAYLNSDGAALLSLPFCAEATFSARRGRQESNRIVSRARVPNPVLFLLQKKPWVPCEDGIRRRPDQIILSRVGSSVLAGTFHRHAVPGGSNLLKAVGGRSCVDAVLLRLGAVNALEDLTAEQVYDLLLQLPDRDPDGIHASAIYRTILDVGGRYVDQTKRDVFCARGHLWGRRGEESRYYSVAELRYWSRGVLPQPVQESVPLVALEPRKSSAEVNRIFGVQPLQPGDIKIDVDSAQTEYQCWSDLVMARVSSARPHLYALRLAKNVDADGRQRRLLSRARVHVCRCIHATVSVGTRPETRVVINRDCEGVVVGTSVYVVSHEDEFPSGDTLFWRAVADLIGDILDAQVGADFSQVLQYEDDRRRSRMLQHLVGSDAERLLAQARRLFAGAYETEGAQPPIRIPDSTAIAAEPGAVSVADAASSEPVSPVPMQPEVGALDSPSFTPIGGPTPAGGNRRSVVVVSKLPTPSVHVSLVDETETLDIVEAFERSQGRYPVRVAQVREYEGPRCDVLTFAQQADAEMAVSECLVDPAKVARFIEVKGRSQRTGGLELRGNELAAARIWRHRYYLYRVYCDPTNETHRELAILGDPLNSPRATMVETATFHLVEGSGASWFTVELRAGTAEA